MRALVLGAALVAMLAGPAAADEIEQVTAFFLKAYSTGDKQVVISMLDADVEIDTGDAPARGVGAVSDKLDDDIAGWGGGAHFGAIWHVAAERKGALEAIAFDVPLTIGSSAPRTLHYEMIWKAEPDGWKLLRWRALP